MNMGNFKDLDRALKMIFVNNYRKLHGKPVRRRKHIYEQEAKRIRSELKKYFSPSMRIGGYKFTGRPDGGVNIMYVGESE